MRLPCLSATGKGDAPSHHNPKHRPRGGLWIRMHGNLAAHLGDEFPDEREADAALAVFMCHLVLQYPTF